MKFDPALEQTQQQLIKTLSNKNWAIEIQEMYN